MQNSLFWRRRWIGWVLAGCLCGTGVWSPGRAGAAGAIDDGQRFMQAVSQGDTGATVLRLAARAYAHRDRQRPVIWLVAAVHVGDPAYYQAVQAQLEAYELVLYEGVGREDMFEIWGTSPAEKAERTRRQLEALASLVRGAGYLPSESRWVESLDEMSAAWTTPAQSIPANVLMHARVDAWGHEVRYQVDGDAVVLTSLGADGLVGGEGDAADLYKRVSVPKRYAQASSAASGSAKPNREDAAAAGNEPGGAASGGAASGGAASGGAASGGGGINQMHTMLSDMFGLAFQLDTVDYAHAHFVPSDMSAQQAERAFARAGVHMRFSREGGGDDGGDGGGDGGASLISELAGPGAGLSLGIMRVLAKFVAASPSLQELARLMMIEMLSREDWMEIAAGSVGNPQLLEVILGGRNQVVLDDLKQVVQLPEPPATVGVFYGAAHLPEMAEQLREQMGYEPTGEVVWFDAMKADPASTGMPPANVAVTKRFMKQMMDQALVQAQAQNRARTKQ